MLGFIQRFVCALDQSLRKRITPRFVAGEAGTEGHNAGDLRHRMGNGEPGELGSSDIDDLERALLRRGGKEKRELLAAVARHEIGGALAAVCQRGSDLLQALV